jgi:hypothetical protein
MRPTQNPPSDVGVTPSKVEGKGSALVHINGLHQRISARFDRIETMLAALLADRGLTPTLPPVVPTILVRPPSPGSIADWDRRPEPTGLTMVDPTDGEASQ